MKRLGFLGIALFVFTILSSKALAHAGHDHSTAFTVNSTTTSSFGLWNSAPAAPGFGLTAAMRPFFLVLPDGNVRIAGAKLLAPSRDYLGIQVMGINQNVAINTSTILVRDGVESPFTNPYVLANGSEIDLQGMVDSGTGTILVTKVWDVTREKNKIFELKQQIEMLKQRVAELQKMIKNR